MSDVNVKLNTFQQFWKYKTDIAREMQNASVSQVTVFPVDLNAAY
jgi:hypothetical protein